MRWIRKRFALRNHSRDRGLLKSMCGSSGARTHYSERQFRVAKLPKAKYDLFA
jgi:hypothetical protein